MTKKDWLILFGLLIYVIVWSHLFVEGTQELSRLVSIDQGLIFIGMWVFFGSIGTLILKITDSPLLHTTGFNWWMSTIFGGVFTMLVLVPQSIYYSLQRSKKKKKNLKP